MPVSTMLWFDVGIKRYTTNNKITQRLTRLWFDVGIKRYTTRWGDKYWCYELWFDVGIKRFIMWIYGGKCFGAYARGYYNTIVCKEEFFPYVLLLFP